MRSLFVVSALVLSSLVAPLSGADAAKVTKPGKVTTVKASSKNDTLTVSWRKGTGGAPTSYIATLTPSGKKCTTSKTTCSFTKLTNGTKYKISVVAKNSAGSSTPVTSTWTVRWSTNTSVSLSLSSQSTFANTPITATAIVNPATSGGTIAFSVNGSAYPSCATVPVVGDRASCSISAPTVGTFGVRASFSGVGTFLTSNSAITSFVVVARSTSVVLTSDRTPTTHGDLTTFTAAVQPIPNGGTVSFTADGKPIPSCSAVTVNTSTGLATCQYAFDTTGSRAVAADFSGSSNYADSSSSIDITVNKVVTSLVLTVSDNPVEFGKSTILTATVNPVPDGGTVSFTADGNSIPSCSAVTVDTSFGIATCEYASTSTGSSAVAADFSGSSNYAISSSSIDITVNKVVTSLALTATDNPVDFGQSTSLTATISPVPDGGTVSFSADGNLIPSCSAITVDTSTGVATCQYAFTSSGAPAVTAEYSGSSNYAVSSSSIDITVNKVVTSLALTASDNPVDFGQNTTLTATISPVPDGGTVSFTVDGNLIPSCSAVTVDTSTGVATCQFALTSSGTRAVAAAYSGSSNYAVSSSSIDITVNKVVTSLVLTVTDNPVEFNKSTTLTATISPIPDGGTVSFAVDGNPIPSCSAVTVNASTGVASCQYTFTATGSRSVAADYSGSSNYTVSSASLDITVNKVVSSLALTISDNPVEFGKSTTLTAKISPIPDGGTVSFTVDGNPIPSCSAVTVNVSTGVVTCQYAFASTGSRAVAAAYSGSSNYAVSSSSINVTVNKVVTSLVLTSSKNPVLPGQSSTLTATISPIPDGGTVSFTADGNSIPSCSSVTVNTSTGLATCSWSAEPFQAANLSAIYSGTINYIAKTSNTILQDVKLQTVIWSSPGKDTFTVPAGWTKILVTAAGAQGTGNSHSFYGGRSSGGRGAVLNAVISVTPGQELQVNVGAVGGGGSGLSGSAAGTFTSGSGGGSTTLTSGDCTLTSLQNCLVVAAGGGGAGPTLPSQECYGFSNGSDGGAIWNGANFASGATARTSGCPNVDTVYGGGGGTTPSTEPGYNGTFGLGANAQFNGQFGGGGGGHGFWGGSSGPRLSSGSGGAGGAGGSSYVTTASTQFSFLESKQYGSGSLAISNISFKTDTSTTLAFSSSSTTAGTAITATATVTPGTSGGTVGFWVDGSLYPTCTAVAVVSGQASCSISKTSIGNYKIQAAYSGVKINLPSFSAIRVLGVSVNSPKVTLTSSESTPSAGRTITLTANINPIPDGGTVTFYNNRVALNNCVAVPVDLSTGNVSCQYRLTSTVASFTASYAGTSNFGNSNTTTPLTLVVSKAETSLVLTTSKNPIGPGQKTTLTATLSLVPDGGTVTFKSDGVAIALCSAVAVDTTTGIATCSWVPDPYQDSMLSATYSGTTSYSASTSNTVQQRVS